MRQMEEEPNNTKANKTDIQNNNVNKQITKRVSRTMFFNPYLRMTHWS